MHDFSITQANVYIIECTMHEVSSLIRLTHGFVIVATHLTKFPDILHFLYWDIRTRYMLLQYQFYYRLRLVIMYVPQVQV